MRLPEPGSRAALPRSVAAEEDHSLEASAKRRRHGAVLTLEAWRLDEDPRQKPLYTLTATGEDGRTIDNALFVVSRGLEETEWWSVYQLGSGRHLFDTYVPLLSFSISRETVATRYVGFQAPPDDARDARLKRANVVGVFTYASEDRLIREALVTCDDPKRAQLLRSYADTTRKVSLVEGADQPSRTLRLSFSQHYSSPPICWRCVCPCMATISIWRTLNLRRGCM